MQTLLLLLFLLQSIFWLGSSFKILLIQLLMFLQIFYRANAFSTVFEEYQNPQILHLGRLCILFNSNVLTHLVNIQKIFYSCYQEFCSQNSSLHLQDTHKFMRSCERVECQVGFVQTGEHVQSSRWRRTEEHRPFFILLKMQYKCTTFSAKSVF